MFRTISMTRALTKLWQTNINFTFFSVKFDLESTNKSFNLQLSGTPRPHVGIVTVMYTAMVMVDSVSGLSCVLYDIWIAGMALILTKDFWSVSYLLFLSPGVGVQTKVVENMWVSVQHCFLTTVWNILQWVTGKYTFLKRSLGFQNHKIDWRKVDVWT